MKYTELVKALEKENKFFLYGKEPFFKEDFVQKAKLLLNNDFRDFNYDLVDLSSVKYDDAVLRIGGVPMMDNFRVIVLKNFSCRESKSCCWTKDDKEKFSQLIKKLEKDTKLIILSESGDKSTNVFKELCKTCNTYESDKLDHVGLSSFISDYVKNKGFKIEKTLIEYYVGVCGYLHRDSDKMISDVVNDIEKLLSFMVSGKQLTKEEIDSMVVKAEDINVFKMIDFCFKGDIKGALAAYDLLLKEREKPVMIFSILLSSVGLLVKCKILMEKGMAADTIAKGLGENPYRVKTIIRNGASITKDRAKKIFDDLIELDYKYKTGIILETVLVELAIMSFVKK